MKSGDADRWYTRENAIGGERQGGNVLYRLWQFGMERDYCVGFVRTEKEAEQWLVDPSSVKVTL